MVSPDLMFLGSQVSTDYGKFIDVLAMDQSQSNTLYKSRSANFFEFSGKKDRQLGSRILTSLSAVKEEREDRADPPF